MGPVCLLCEEEQELWHTPSFVVGRGHFGHRDTHTHTHTHMHASTHENTHIYTIMQTYRNPLNLSHFRFAYMNGIWCNKQNDLVLCPMLLTRNKNGEDWMRWECTNLYQGRWWGVVLHCSMSGWGQPINGLLLWLVVGACCAGKSGNEWVKLSHPVA